MGDILNIKCNCGFEIDSIGIGGGMNGVSQLYSCKKCQNFGVTHSSLTYVKCDNCSKSIFKKLFLNFYYVSFKFKTRQQGLHPILFLYRDSPRS